MAFCDQVSADDKKSIHRFIDVEELIQKRELVFPAELEGMKKQDAEGQVYPYDIKVIILPHCHIGG